MVIMAALCLLMASAAYADGTITFVWNASTGKNVTGYRLYQRTADRAYVSPAWEGPGLTCAVTVPDGTYLYVARAYNAAGESGNSNEITVVVSSLPPTPPGNLSAPDIDYPKNAEAMKAAAKK